MEPEDEEDKAAIVKRVRRLLYRRMRVRVSDGRVFVGKFQCIDKQGNLILYDTVELRPSPSVELGLVLIPKHCQISCDVECSLDEQLSSLVL